MRNPPLSLPYLACLLLITACGKDPDVAVYDDAAIADETQKANWLAYGRTHNERRFSPSDQIDTSNVASLKVDWFLDLPGDVGLVSTPLVVDGTLYFTGTMNVIRAVDARTGNLLWTYDPQVAKEIAGKRRTGWKHNRGISFYEGKLFAATWDGRLFALDAKSGEELWMVRTFGLDQALYITGAPKAFAGKVLIGNGGTESGPTRGWVTAYDADTGEEAWKFHIVPGNPADGFENEAMAMAAKTWTGEWWRHGGGGNAWHGFTYDPEFNAVYIGTGNGSPWNRKIRSPGGGDNLFLCSIVALDADTGRYLWHYQTTPGETWDYNSNMDIVLADLDLGGEAPVKALMHAPKNGFFYVIDRATGKLISAEAYVETTWATHIDIETGRPVEVPGARYEVDAAYITPNAYGGHSWHAMSYSPQTGLAYIPAQHYATNYSDLGFDIDGFRMEPFVGGFGVNPLPAEPPREYPASLIAWDPVRQEAAWEIPQASGPNGGTLTTAGGLLFQGRADGRFIAYDAASGDELWNFDMGLGMTAAPITWELDGRQYVSILVGWGGGAAGIGSLFSSEEVSPRHLGWAYGKHMRRLVTFSLEGTVDMPPQPPPYYAQPLEAPEFVVDAELADRGALEFGGCMPCHGLDALAAGMAPDLRESAVALDKDAFAAVVRDGSLVARGMPGTPDITDAQLEALQHYIRRRARETR
ncbi:MAG: PQQ-dependent dehydrogenase, methanol/ethanol family [Woeseiaceae bacterium]|nr:PQQ-dependent dehydrogenase, methanol/ethanol family [Woeseiaceae bacterium]